MVDLEKRLKGCITSYIVVHANPTPKQEEMFINPLKELLQNPNVLDMVVTNTDSFAFYLLVKNFNLPKKMIEERQNLERIIVNNSDKYSASRVKENLCSLLFRNNSKNVNNILITLKESAQSLPVVGRKYKPYSNLFDKVLELLERGEISSKTLQEISKLNKQIEKQGKRVDEITKELLYLASDESCKEMKKSTSGARKMISNIQPEEYISKNGSSVKFYKIQNQTEYQRNFTMLMRTCSIVDYMTGPNAMETWKKSAKAKRAWSYSVINENKHQTFSKGNRVAFGFFDVGNVSFSSATCRDGQTGQFAMTVEQPFFRQQFTDMKQLVEKTAIDSYNELQIFNPEEILPSVVICEQETPTEKEIEIAKSFGIPIIYIDKTCYAEPVCTKAEETKEKYEKLKYNYPTFLEEPLTDIAMDCVVV